MKNENLKIRLRIPKSVYDNMMSDLSRQHDFAYERVGFAFATTTAVNTNTLIVTFNDYRPVKDSDYIEDESVGAKINSNAIRGSMQHCIDYHKGGFHVHIHNHMGRPIPSETDTIGLPGIVDSLMNVTDNQANGILILSKDSFYAVVKINGYSHYVVPEVISVIGYPMQLQFTTNDIIGATSGIFDRQSFLGNKSENIFENIKVGIVGLGGGGSHIVQQLAHIGVRNITIFDDDIIEPSNLNRLVGAYHSDIEKEELKSSIAKRLILNISPSANIYEVQTKWQNQPEDLQKCDVVFGCVDTYISRQQLEAECRRYLIPYIDIGMDVFKDSENKFYMSGQIILSMPGMSGMKNMGFITEDKLAAEAAKYGNVGGRPQVIWPNGVLASSAVGVFVDIVTGWTGQKDKLVYLSYDGNLGTLNPHLRLEYINPFDSEYSLMETGKPMFKKI